MCSQNSTQGSTRRRRRHADAGTNARTSTSNSKISATSAQQKPTKFTSNHQQTCETQRSKLCTRAGTWHHHRTGDPFVRSPSCTKSLASSSSSHYNPRLTPTTFLTKQASDRATSRQTTFSRSSNSDRLQPLCVAGIDFKRAFDTVKHSSVWKASRKQGIEEPSIPLLTKLYDQQRATVHTDAKSKHFPLERGTKHGDPLSTLLFNSLLQHIVKPAEGKWKRDNHGVELAEHDPDTNLSNLRFADDILLISGSLKNVTNMLARPDHSNDGTRPAISLHENQHNLQYDIKTRKRQHCGSSRNEHRDPTA